MADGFFLFADCPLQWGEGKAAEVLFLWVLSGAFADALGGWAVFAGEFCVRTDGGAKMRRLRILTSSSISS